MRVRSFYTKQSRNSFVWEGADRSVENVVRKGFKKNCDVQPCFYNYQYHRNLLFLVFDIFRSSLILEAIVIVCFSKDT